jgi:HlyD family secretion protein
MKKKLLIFAVVVVVGIIVLALIQRSRKGDDGVLVLSGTIEVTEASLGFKVPGKIVELRVEEGQKVKTGDRLAALDRAEQESQLAQSRAALREASVRLAEFVNGARPQELERARAEMSAAEAELRKAEADFKRAENLYRKEAISTDRMESAKRTFDVAASRNKQAAESLSLVREGTRKEQIAAAEQRVQEARAVVSASEARLADTELYAPMDGVILVKVRELGETVGAGTPVYKLGDLERPWVKVYIKEDKLGLVKLGQKARVTTDTYRGKVYEGTVTYIAGEAEFTPKNVQTQEERVKLVFAAKVSVKNENGELKPGMPADVRIEVK